MNSVVGVICLFTCTVVGDESTMTRLGRPSSIEGIFAGRSGTVFQMINLFGQWITLSNEFNVDDELLTEPSSVRLKCYCKQDSFQDQEAVPGQYLNVLIPTATLSDFQLIEGRTLVSVQNDPIQWVLSSARAVHVGTKITHYNAGCYRNQSSMRTTSF